MIFIFQSLQLKMVNWTEFSAINYSSEPAVRQVRNGVCTFPLVQASQAE